MAIAAVLVRDAARFQYDNVAAILQGEGRNTDPMRGLAHAIMHKRTKKSPIAASTAPMANRRGVKIVRQRIKALVHASKSLPKLPQQPSDSAPATEARMSHPWLSEVSVRLPEFVRERGHTTKKNADPLSRRTLKIRQTKKNHTKMLIIEVCARAREPCWSMDCCQLRNSSFFRVIPLASLLQTENAVRVSARKRLSLACG